MVAPIVDGARVIGDPALYATVGDMRIGAVERDGSVTVLGAGEQIELVIWSEATGVARLAVEVPTRGWTALNTA